MNHPNILTVYEIGEAGDKYYIATEYIEGETLRHCLWREPLKLDEALGVAIQVAMALEAAHAAGIVHRDIKPENIMLRQDRFVRDRFVKVLDFGLAKLTDRDSGAADPEAVTIPISETNPGIIIGTSGYMSPEQAQGESVDTRSDIFSLGVVLYEMIAGQQPFKGRTDSHTRVSIIDHDPVPLVQHVADVPRSSIASSRKRWRKAQTISNDHRSKTRSRAATRRGPHLNRRTDRAAAASHSFSRNRVCTAGANRRAVTDGDRSETSAPAQYDHRTAITNGLASWAVPAVLAAVSIAIIVYYAPHRRSTPIAILPFVNDTKDPNAEYLSDGITESIINSLSQLPNLRVMSRNAAFRFKSSNTIRWTRDDT